MRMLEWRGAIRTSSSRLEPVRLRIWGPEPDGYNASAWVDAPLIRARPFKIHGADGVQAIELAWRLVFELYAPRLVRLRLVADRDWPAAFAGEWRDFRRAMAGTRIGHFVTWHCGSGRISASISTAAALADGESWLVMLRAPRLFPLAVPFTAFSPGEAAENARRLAARLAQDAGCQLSIRPQPKVRA
jgi:hypothetical protein